MGLSERVARFALRGAHVLIVESPGQPLLRMQAEAGVLGEGWAIATTPADADVLLVCGPVSDEVAPAVEHVWEQMVAPRVRYTIRSTVELPDAIHAARHALLDVRMQRAEAATRQQERAAGRPSSPTDPGSVGNGSMDHTFMNHGSKGHGAMDDPATDHGSMDDPATDPGAMDNTAKHHGSMDDPATDPGAMDNTAKHHGSMDHRAMDHGAMDHGSMDHGAMDHGSMDHGAMDHGSMDHGAMDHGAMDHGSMDHGGMNMTGPAGIPLAQGEDDRDGLEMDVLHVSLGPLLAAWPSNLVLRCTLHGDTIAAAEAEVLPAGTEAYVPTRHEQDALLVDAVTRTVRLAGWEPVAIELRRVRDHLLSPSPDRQRIGTQFDRLARRIRRSRTLRWALRGVRPSSTQKERAGADAYELLLALLEHASQRIGGSGEQPRPMPTASAADLEAAVVGQDLATARLVVAALTPWGTVMSPVATAVTGAGGE